MKTSIIQLETHDDLVSVRDKITWSKSQRIILVFPQKVKGNFGVLDLRLIQRSAKTNGANIALVTRDRLVIENANEVGIPVFNSVPKAERADWGGKNVFLEEKEHAKGTDLILQKKDALDEENRPEKIGPIFRSIIFLFALAALILMAAFVFPSAIVKIYPAAATQELSITVTASTDVGEVNITGLIPAQAKTFTLSLEKTANSTGTAVLPQTKASGFCTVKSLSSNEVILPAGVLFSTGGENPIRFISMEETVLRAKNSTADIRVEALLPGEEGNAESGEISTVEGVYETMIEVTNAETFSGGSSLTVPTPTEEDYERLRIAIKDELTDQTKEEIQGKQTETEKAIIESLQLDKVISETESNSIGEPSDTLKLTINAQYRVLTYNPQDVASLMVQIFDANIMQGIHPVDQSPVIENLGNATKTGIDTYQWQVKGKRKTVKDWNQNLLSGLIKGKKIDEAIAIINAHTPGTQPASITTIPGFWKRLPYLTSQIKFEEVVSQ